MRVIALLIIICCSFTIVKSQERKLSIEVGKSFEVQSKSSIDDIVGFDSSGIYIIRKMADGFNKQGISILEHYDMNFSFTKSFKLNVADHNTDATFSRVIHHNNKLYVFYSILDPKTKVNTLYVNEINKQTLQLRERERERIIRQYDASDKSRNVNSKSYFRFSSDGSKVLVTYGLPHNEYESEFFGFTVLDSEFNILWQRNVEIPYDDDLFDVKSFSVDNEGDAYLLGAVYKKKRKDMRSGLPNYTHEVFICQDNGKTLTRFPINIDDHFLKDMQIEVMTNKTLVCSGFFSEKGAKSIGGAYYISVDLKSLQIKAKTFEKFDFDFVTQNLSNNELDKSVRQKERGISPELYQYELDKLLVDEDGNIFLIGEQVYTKEERTYISNGSSINSFHYYNDDIIVVKIDPNGKILFTHKIPKKQHSVNNEGFYSSYSIALVGTDIYFIFNDNLKNLEKNNQRRASNLSSSESVTIIAHIDQFGRVSKRPILSLQIYQAQKLDPKSVHRFLKMR